PTPTHTPSLHDALPISDRLPAGRQWRPRAAAPAPRGSRGPGVPHPTHLRGRRVSEGALLQREHQELELDDFHPALHRTGKPFPRSEEHTSELQSRENLV